MLKHFFLEDSYDEPSSISESSDESLSLSPSDSSDDELYFLLLEPLGFLLGESCLFFWLYLFSVLILLRNLLFEVLSSGRVSDETSSN